MKLIYLYTLVFFIASCGVRKTETKIEKKEVEITTTEKVVTVDTSNVEIKFDKQTEILTIEAKDNTKPFVYNGKKHFNVVLKHEKKKDNTLYKKDIKVSKIEDKQQNTKVKESIKDKKVERSNYLSYIYIILILVIYLIIRKYIKRYI